MVTITWIEKCPSSSTSVFLLIIICFSSFMSEGGGGGRGEEEGVRRGGAMKEVLQVDLPCASQLSFLNICFR